MSNLLALQALCESVLVFDTETTGLRAAADEIIEFSAVKLGWHGGTLQTLCEVDTFVRTANNRALPPKIVELTGITDELLRQEGVSKQALCSQLAQLLTPKTLLVAYNAQFDLLFLYYLLEKHGDARLLRDLPKLDLLTVYRDRRPFPHKLCNAIDAYALQERFQNSHRAIDDVRATAAVLCAMDEERGDLAQYINLFGYSRRYGLSGPRIGSVHYLPQGYEPTVPLYEQRAGAGAGE